MIEKLRDKRESIAVFDGDIIELAIVDIKIEEAVGLFDKENGRAEERLG
jgi:hypothetical protein